MEFSSNIIETSTCESFFVAIEDSITFEEQYDADEENGIIDEMSLFCYKHTVKQPEPIVIDDLPQKKKRGRPKKQTSTKTKRPYCVYVHRLKSGKIFYIGCGKTYIRPMDGTNRNNLWKAVSKGEFTYEILKDNLSQTEAYALETQLINEYGRLVLGTGTLTNIVGGGKISQYRNEYIELTQIANILSEFF